MKLILVFIAFSIFKLHSQELVFNSGFELGTVITDPLDANYSDLIGVDSSYSSPNDWVGDLDQHPNIGGFRYQYSGGDTSKRFIKLVPDPTNPSNTVMQFWMKHANDPIGNTGLFKGRIQAALYGCTTLHNFSQSVRMYLSDDWNILKNTDNFTMNWMTILEFWNDGGWTNSPFPFRAALGIIKEDSSGTDLTFKVHFDTLQVSINKWVKMYTEVDSSFSIPTEKWMTLEYYYEEGDENNGKFIFAVTPDGEPKQVIFDITYYTRHPLDMNPNGLHALNPMKMYTHSRNIDTIRNNGGILQMYWDDFKFWKDTNILCENLVYDVQNACNSYTWIDGNTYNSSNNSATYTLTNAEGCDSVVTLNLTITGVDTTTTTNDITITANQNGALYQWIECDNGNTPITGETGQSFTATTNGDYSVLVSLNGCSVASSCVTISTVSKNENSFGAEINLFPNPTTDLITLKLGELTDVQVTITDLSGEIVYTKKHVNNQNLNVFMKNFANGTYLLEVLKGKDRRVFNVIKQ